MFYISFLISISLLVLELRWIAFNVIKPLNIVPPPFPNAINAYATPEAYPALILIALSLLSSAVCFFALNYGLPWWLGKFRGEG